MIFCQECQPAQICNPTLCTFSNANVTNTYSHFLQTRSHYFYIRLLDKEEEAMMAILGMVHGINFFKKWDRTCHEVPFVDHLSRVGASCLHILCGACNILIRGPNKNVGNNAFHILVLSSEMLASFPRK